MDVRVASLDIQLFRAVTQTPAGSRKLQLSESESDYGRRSKRPVQTRQPLPKTARYRLAIPAFVILL